MRIPPIGSFMVLAKLLRENPNAIQAASHSGRVGVWYPGAHGPRLSIVLQSFHRLTQPLVVSETTTDQDPRADAPQDWVSRFHVQLSLAVSPPLKSHATSSPHWKYFPAVVSMAAGESVFPARYPVNTALAPTLQRDHTCGMVSPLLHATISGLGQFI
jgi:hypothetical protein